MDANARVTELERTFVPPPRLSSSRPRSVELTAGGRVLTVVAVAIFGVAIAVGIGMSRAAGRDANQYRALVERGVMTTAYVTRLWQGGDDEGRRVRYRFTVDDRSYDAQTQVSSARRRTLTVGSPIDVRYVPDDPRINRVGPTPRRGMPLWAPYVVATGIAAIGVLCLFGINRQRRLLSEGRAAPALVTALKTQRGTHGEKHRSITYDFPLMSGAVASGKSSTSSKPPAVGSVICIIYDPECPKRNKAYPFDLVRPAA